jgi:8-oxo-dGTP diphosphatase
MIDVAAGLVFRAGRLLITQRRLTDHLGGLWEFPGGKREPAESFEECLRRELREELSIEVEVLDCVATVRHTYPEKAVHLQFFRCGWLSGEPQRLGCHDFAWVDAAQLADYTFPPADLPLLRRLLSEPELWPDQDLP